MTKFKLHYFLKFLIKRTLAFLYLVLSYYNFNEINMTCIYILKHFILSIPLLIVKFNFNLY